MAERLKYIIYLEVAIHTSLPILYNDIFQSLPAHFILYKRETKMLWYGRRRANDTNGPRADV